MSAWILPITIIVLVGFGIFLIATAWEGYSFDPATLGVGCAVLMAALFMYKIWNQKTKGKQ
ncbi:hypothetical protein VKY20_00675 [Pseudomonas atacamensis]|uniref:hypothetical protein n=1 Tax=Pseudomonas atacamensis TaxID=2565368 RepID=UPI002B49CEA7|nr:hypothetical protein [Pseudomonas atacamensis]MEB2854111.1 hypothetical protein [Pseudomonas atacamensis]